MTNYVPTPQFSKEGQPLAYSNANQEPYREYDRNNYGGPYEQHRQPPIQSYQAENESREFVESSPDGKGSRNQTPTIEESS